MVPMSAAGAAVLGCAGVGIVAVMWAVGAVGVASVSVVPLGGC